MASLLARLREPRTAAGLILFAAVATIAGALIFEHVFGILPCPLCLRQRKAYYVAVPIALAAIFVPDVKWTRVGLGLLALVFLVSTGLGIHHAGVEWGWWLGPSDCAGTPAPAPGGMGDFLKQLQTTRVVSCSEASWRFLGLSLAGYNALISLGLAAVAAGGLVGQRGNRASTAPQPYGSSSVSQ
jgi:disulfide bond formation protein DsbB